MRRKSLRSGRRTARKPNKGLLTITRAMDHATNDKWDSLAAQAHEPQNTSREVHLSVDGSRVDSRPVWHCNNEETRQVKRQVGADVDPSAQYFWH